jgi:uroporphyrin-III C-methyltransferase/precorrin-2 dehydrogenase/sirohydrochlorin ferrochelatase
VTDKLLPVFILVENAHVVVTGSGPSARDAAARLVELGARVKLVAPDSRPLVGAEIVGATPTADLLEEALLLVCASDDAATDAAILEAASSRRILCVNANRPEGRAFLGACEQRGTISVAVTTCGRSTVLESRLAAEAAGAVQPHHERLAEILEAIRAKLEARIPDDATRNAIWEQILDSPVSLLLQSGSDDEAVEMAERMAWGTG